METNENDASEQNAKMSKKEIFSIALEKINKFLENDRKLKHQFFNYFADNVLTDQQKEHMKKKRGRGISRRYETAYSRMPKTQHHEPIMADSWLGPLDDERGATIRRGADGLLHQFLGDAIDTQVINEQTSILDSMREANPYYPEQWLLAEGDIEEAATTTFGTYVCKTLLKQALNPSFTIDSKSVEDSETIELINEIWTKWDLHSIITQATVLAAGKHSRCVVFKQPDLYGKQRLRVSFIPRGGIRTVKGILQYIRIYVRNHLADSGQRVLEPDECCLLVFNEDPVYNGTIGVSLLNTVALDCILHQHSKEDMFLFLKDHGLGKLHVKIEDAEEQEKIDFINSYGDLRGISSLVTADDTEITNISNGQPSFDMIATNMYVAQNIALGAGTPAAGALGNSEGALQGADVDQSKMMIVYETIQNEIRKWIKRLTVWLASDEQKEKIAIWDEDLNTWKPNFDVQWKMNRKLSESEKQVVMTQKIQNLDEIGDFLPVTQALDILELSDVITLEEEERKYSFNAWRILNREKIMKELPAEIVQEIQQFSANNENGPENEDNANQEVVKQEEEDNQVKAEPKNGKKNAERIADSSEQTYEFIDAREKITDEMMNYFLERTDRHVELVNKYYNMICKSTGQNQRILEHDYLKYIDPEIAAYVLMTWARRNESGEYEGEDNQKYFELSDDEKEAINNAIVHHVKNSTHHPEFWDAYWDGKINETIVDATGMLKSSINEMVADWLSMSTELGTDVFEWAKNNINKRWKFTEEQEKYIYTLLELMTEQIKNENLGDSSDEQIKKAQLSILKRLERRLHKAAVKNNKKEVEKIKKQIKEVKKKLKKMGYIK